MKKIGKNMNEMINLLPEMTEKYDVLLKNVMAAKKEMGFSVKKDSANPFHKSKYASLGAHLDLCESILDKHGLILIQTINGSPEKPILIASLCHVESGQWIKSYLPLPNPKNDSQGLGSSITYMRRYSISSMLGLNAEDDDGETSSGRGKNKKVEAPESAPNDDPQLQELLNMFQKDDRFLLIEYMDEVMKHFSWTKGQVIEAFLRDIPSLNKKFELWKNKRILPKDEK